MWDEWQESLMGQWPFGYKPSAEQLAVQEAIACLEWLESYLDYEDWEMDQIEAQENGEFDDDDDDDDDDTWSEDEGYNSDEAEGGDDMDMDLWVFGLAPVLGRIEL